MHLDGHQALECGWTTLMEMAGETPLQKTLISTLKPNIVITLEVILIINLT